MQLLLYRSCSTDLKTDATYFDITLGLSRKALSMKALGEVLRAQLPEHVKLGHVPLLPTAGWTIDR